MKNDNPDTFPEAEQTRWQETVAEDVFLPTVRVQLNWSDVEAAVAQGAIVPQQAHALWAAWAMPGSETRLSASSPEASRSGDYVAPSTLESDWGARRPMPVIEKQSPLPVVVGFVTGALVVLAAVALYSLF
ncbi:hypothetical protein LPB72_03570 [Hydrogenophaga crassostreae]|uniref:Uncharacterized protein n=1 Tax=Hydrogenophaga crassostreae TaxID=1763535 RepID=A0A162PBY4_9BURK|nr:hypothetical protein [Hydrogenophaga crassostreae]AOW14359.1 hypothetical protein LPB072_17465 [Hydrogenophaga crassostreae]OAD43618.1 hypothetical protein LPB72_03570 [Hydrogenophaga crassostreae]